MASEPPKAWRKFHVILAGTTNMAHLSLVRKLHDIDQIQVESPENCDYYVAFCPVSSRVGTDIIEAQDHIPDDKPVILVVMHPTHNRNYALSNSRRWVTKPNIQLTVDCLFYDHTILNNCKRNDDALQEIQKFLGVTNLSPVKAWMDKNRLLIFGIVVAVVLTAVVVGLAVRFLR